jgi:hypothetical protein
LASTTLERDDVVGNATVPEVDDTIGTRGEVGVVGHDDSSDPATAGGHDEVHHRLPVGRVERPRGLVREQKPSFADDGAGDGDTLALAARELVGEMGRPVAEAELAEGSQTSCPGLPRRHAIELERQRDVLSRRQPGKEIEILEYVADRAAPQSCLGVTRHAGQR